MKSRLTTQESRNQTEHKTDRPQELVDILPVLYSGIFAFLQRVHSFVTKDQASEEHGFSRISQLVFIRFALWPTPFTPFPE